MIRGRFVTTQFTPGYFTIPLADGRTKFIRWRDIAHYERGLAESLVDLFLDEVLAGDKPEEPIQLLRARWRTWFHKGPL